MNHYYNTLTSLEELDKLVKICTQLQPLIANNYSPIQEVIFLVQYNFKGSPRNQVVFSRNFPNVVSRNNNSFSK